MTDRLDHLCRAAARLGAPLLLLLLGAAALSSPTAWAASAYPAGASRPAIPARRFEFARTSSASRAVRPGHARKKKVKKPALHGDPARALVAFEAMQRYYYLQGSGLYVGEPFSYLWPFSQAFAATVTMSNVPVLAASFVPEIHARLIGLRTYLDISNSGAPEGSFTSTLAAFDGTVAPPAGPGGTKYYDDNEWVGIELARLYRITHNVSELGTAEGIM